jgi:hypothetical protein
LNNSARSTDNSRSRSTLALKTSDNDSNTTSSGLAEASVSQMHSSHSDSIGSTIINIDERNIDQSSFSTNETQNCTISLNPLEMNFDSKSITLLNMSSVATNQSSMRVNESSIDNQEFNIYSRLGNMTFSRQLVNESNFSSGSTTMDVYEQNFDDHEILTLKADPFLMQKSKRIKIDSSIKELKSETSNTTFTNSSQSTNHKRIHSKEKLFACDQYDSTFSKKSNLTSYKIVHTGEKPYSCYLCPKKFARSHHLTAHKRIHTREKPYSCDLCQKKFTYSSDLRSHKEYIQFRTDKTTRTRYGPRWPPTDPNGPLWPPMCT